MYNKGDAQADAEYFCNSFYNGSSAVSYSEGTSNGDGASTAVLMYNGDCVGEYPATTGERIANTSCSGHECKLYDQSNGSDVNYTGLYDIVCSPAADDRLYTNTSCANGKWIIETNFSGIVHGACVDTHDGTHGETYCADMSVEGNCYDNEWFSSMCSATCAAKHPNKDYGCQPYRSGPYPPADPTKAATFLASHGDWHFYKVPTGCTSGACVSKACADAGMVTPCAGPPGCEYNYNEMACILTSELGCNQPMSTTAGILCGVASTKECSHFEEVYTYMGTWNNGAACGLRDGSFVSTVYILQICTRRHQCWLSRSHHWHNGNVLRAISSERT